MPESATAPVYGDYPRNEMHPYLPAGARRVLDVGCHTGAFGRSLKRLGVAEVWGVEMNAEAAAGAAAHLDRVLVGAFRPSWCRTATSTPSSSTTCSNT